MKPPAKTASRSILPGAVALALLLSGLLTVRADCEIIRPNSSAKTPAVVAPSIPAPLSQAPLAEIKILPAGIEPGLPAPGPRSQPPSVASDSPVEPIADPDPSASSARPKPQAQRQANTPLARGLRSLAKALSPLLNSAARADIGPTEAARSGRGIMDVILGEKTAVQGQGHWSLPRNKYPGDEAVLARKITETTFVVLDIEITSFIPFAEVSAPIDIGAVKFRLREDGSLKILDHFTRRVNPGDLPVSAEVTALTAITKGDLHGKPGLARVLPDLWRFLGEDSVLLAHNAAFDVSHLAYRAKELGLTLPPQPVLDIKEIAKSLFPGLKSYSVEPLMNMLRIGDIEDHQGASDSLNEAMIFAKSVQRLAGERRAKVSGLTVADMAALATPLNFNSVLDRMASLSIEPARVIPVPEDPLQAETAVLRAQSDRHRQMLPNMLRDVAYALGFEYGWLRDRLRQAHLLTVPAPTDGILRDLTRKPPSAVILDYDNTLTERGPDGLSLPVDEATSRALLDVLKTGIPVAIMSTRSFDHNPPVESGVSLTLWEPLVQKIPPFLRRNLFISGRVGGQLVLFDWRGKPVRYLDGRWTADEERKYRESVAAAAARLNVPAEDFRLIEVPGQTNVLFKKDHPLSGEFAEALIDEFRSRKLLYPVIHYREWVYFNKFDKGDGIRLLFTAMKARGFPVTEEGILYVADEFKAPVDRPMGGDTAAAQTFPATRMVSVGDAGNDPVPPNVRRFGIQASRGSRRVLEAVYQGLMARPRSMALWPSWILRRIRYRLFSWL